MNASVTPPRASRRVKTASLHGFTWRRVLRDRRTRVGVTLLACVLLLAVAGPALAPHAPDAVVGFPASSPSGAALLGTDYLGRDVLSRILSGGWSVVWMSATAASLGVLLGAVTGMAAGYLRGAVDSILMRLMDVIFAFPQIVLALLFVAFLGPQLWLIVGLVALTWVPQVARVVRGVTLEIVHQEYIEWGETVGMPRWRTIVGDILPNVVTPLMVELGLKLTWSIALVASISFLGFGIQPPSPDWGLMISENRNLLATQPWPVIAPAFLIALFALGANLTAEGVSRATTRVGARA